MTNIFIVRHGETEYNRTNRIQGRGINEPLNEKGRTQACSVGTFLKKTTVDHIFSSSLKRSIETAEIIADHLALPFLSYAELDEMNFGVIEGQPINEISNELDQLHQRWKGGNTNFALQDGESPDIVLNRVLSRADVLLEEHEGETLVFVLHGRLIRILLAHWLEYGLADMHRIDHQNGALYHLRLKENEKMEPVFLNRIEHLNES